MKIVCTAKRVPDTTEVKTDPVTGVLQRKGVPSIINPDDMNALEAALEIRDEIPGSTVTTVTMGPDAAKIKLHELLGMGADRAVLLSDRFFGGADTLICSRTLAAGIKKLGDVDLVLCGHQAIDGDTAQVGPEIARRLGIPSVSAVCGLRVKDGKAYVTRKLDDGTEELEVNLPCLLTVTKELNEPRYMTMYNIVDSFNDPEKEITVWNHEDIGLEKEQLGLKASPTRVVKTFTQGPRGKCEVLDGTPAEAAKCLVETLDEKHLIK
jgi:electron transfer flavoprotein alpha/beta subunit